MLSLPDGLIWIASFPKSGNTWLRILLSNMISGKEVPEDINNLVLDSPIAAARRQFEQEMLVDSLYLTQHELVRLRPLFHEAQASGTGPRFLKTHDAFVRAANGRPLLGQGARAALYLVRDPRDVVVSLASHMNASLDQALNLLNDPDGIIGGDIGQNQFRQSLTGWSGHVQSWLDQQHIPVHAIRYEDLRADTLAIFCGALDFLGACYEREAVLRAVRHADFSEMRRQERERGFRERLHEDKMFFRQGKVGDWRDHLPPGQARMVETAHADTMTRLGYKLEMQRTRA